MTKLIAEFCQNHNGKIEILEKMIISAKNNGATHAKIQGLYSHELTKRNQFESPENIIFRPHAAEVLRLSKLDLSEENERWFVQKCEELSIIPMITVFSHSGVERAKRAGFKSIKIASYDCGSLAIIDKVMEFAMEIVISTGATHWDEIKKTAELLHNKKRKHQKIAFLHARTIYPTPLSQSGLLRMCALTSFGFPTGFSDHTKPEETQLIASKCSIVLGAEYIERHFTILGKNETKDGPISITPTELLELYNFAKLSKIDQLNSLPTSLFEEVLLCDSLEPTQQEKLNREYYRGRVASNFGGRTVYSWEKI